MALVKNRMLIEDAGLPVFAVRIAIGKIDSSR
jgi:hypothetical protein